MRSVVLFHNEDKAEAVQALKAVRSLLKENGVRTFSGQARGGLAGRLKDCDFAIALGGDGTVLRAARILAPYSVPLLGINAGGLGFLSATDPAGFRRDAKRIVQGEFQVEPRMMLTVEVRRGMKAVFGPHTALNEVVIRCGELARPVNLEVETNGKFVASYFGDGLIVATPTGSTAYALAVGGPVVVPGVDAYLIAPICSHALTQRPLITPARNPVSVRMTVRSAQDKPEGRVSLDGQMVQTLLVGDEVRIRRNPQPSMLLVPPERSHFELLRGKLKWGERGGG